MATAVVTTSITSTFIFRTLFYFEPPSQLTNQNFCDGSLWGGTNWSIFFPIERTSLAQLRYKCDSCSFSKHTKFSLKHSSYSALPQVLCQYYKSWEDIPSVWWLKWFEAIDFPMYFFLNYDVYCIQVKRVSSFIQLHLSRPSYLTGLRWFLNRSFCSR